MRQLAVPVLAALLAFAATPAQAQDCSPAPHVISIECAGLPVAVSLIWTPATGVQVASVGASCGAPVVSGSQVEVACASLWGLPVCTSPLAFGAFDVLAAAVSITTEASCSGGAPVSCTATGTGPASNFCLQQGSAANAGGFPLTCKATVTGSPTAWFAVCAQPV